MDKNGEIAHINELLEKISNTRGSFEKTQVVREVFEFLADTTHILRFKKFRASIKNKITAMTAESPDIVAILRPSMDKLCAKIKSIDPSDSTIGCPEVAPLTRPNNYDVLGMGGYGAVIKPALPNMVDGKLTEFPGNVTKVFFEEKSLKDAMRKIALLPKIMGNDPGHRSEPYTQKYRVRNMPSNVVDRLKTKQPYTSLNDPVHIMRMPNLGSDVTHIGTVYKQLLSVPVLTILEQIQKVLHQTARLANRGYGHFDIRDTNVMVTPETGAITIIDFDILDKYEDLYQHYSFGFYSNPPESLMFESMGTLLYMRDNTDYINVADYIDNGMLDKYIENNMNNFKTAFGTHRINNHDEFEEALMDALRENLEYLYDLHEGRTSDLFIDHSMPYFDNYGLGLTLLEFLSHLYPYYEDGHVDYRKRAKESVGPRITKNGVAYTDAELEAIITAFFSTTELLKHMSSMLIAKRPLPADAASTMDAIVATYKQSIPAMSNNARAELNRMALLANGNMSSTPAMSNNARAELNRMAVLAATGKTRKLRRRPARS